MNANELMIGDWVLFSGEPKRVKSIVISDNGVERIYVFGNTCQVSTIEAYVQPIPITPEILEKNGFAKGGMFGNMYYLAVGDFEISVYFAHANTQLIVEKRNGKEIINILNVEYLHILQHALKLCGIEKTFEL